MAQYIATGKDLHNESSIKITAESDQQALWFAKQQLPVVWKLERIEPDGSLRNIEGLAFDSPETVLVSNRDIEDLRQQERTKRKRISKAIVIACLLVAVMFVLECFNHIVFHPRDNQPITPQTAPAATQK